MQGSGCTPVVVLTKADKVDDLPTRALAALARQRRRSGRGGRASTRKRPGSVARAAPWLEAGRTAVLVGSSGAGKSTLTNTLLGIDRMKTAAVRDNDARGRHTTTHRALMPLPSGACLIDTPGMRELKPTGEEVVAENFTDIEALAGECQFSDCRHEARARLCGARGDRGRHADRAALRALPEIERRSRRRRQQARHAPGAEGGAGQHRASASGKRPESKTGRR